MDRRKVIHQDQPSALVGGLHGSVLAWHPLASMKGLMGPKGGMTTIIAVDPHATSRHFRSGLADSIGPGLGPVALGMSRTFPVSITMFAGATSEIFGKDSIALMLLARISIYIGACTFALSMADASICNDYPAQIDEINAVCQNCIPVHCHRWKPCVGEVIDRPFQCLVWGWSGGFERPG